MSSRGFSLLAGVVSVAAITAVLIAPVPLRRIGARIAHAQYAAFARGVDAVSDSCSLRSLTRLALRAVSRSRRAAATPAFAGPSTRAPQADPWRALAPGIRLRTVSFTATSGESMKVHEVSLDPTRASLRVTLASEPAAVAVTAAQTRALAALNASYFDEDRRPLGYLKIDGRVINGSVATGAAFTGVLTVKGRVARIVSRAAFDGHRADTALQAGPRLVADGAPTVGLRETRAFRQSGVAVTRAGQVVLYATDGSYRGITWAEMQRLLTGPAACGGIDPRDVLNLDGGSSSQIYVRTPGAIITTGFPTSVPVILAAHPR